MNGFRNIRRRLRSERGQTLILGLMAVIILIVGILVLFDVQRVIRGKVKVMSAIDAAALTGAKWQQNTLNLIGEMNLIKACTVLITDPAYGIGGDLETFPGGDDSEKEQLKHSADLLTQMQVRVAFVGPLIGFGAAQQAAKNNGLTYNESCNTFLQEMLSDISSGEYYGNPDIVKQEYYGFRWRDPYAKMIYAILGPSDNGTSKGVAVGTNVDYLGMPKLLADRSERPPVTVVNYLQNRTVMEAIAAEDWCILRALLPNNDGIYYQEKWWGNIEIEPSKKSLEGSEILPVHVKTSEGGDFYTRADENGMLDEVIQRIPGREEELKKLGTAYNTGENSDDGKNHSLPELSWSIFDSDWCSYSEYGVDTGSWENYLRGPFRQGVDYRSGALSYFSIRVPDETILRQFRFREKFSRPTNRTQTEVDKIGFQFGGTQSGMGKQINQYGAQTESALTYFDDDDFQITFDATAKTLGYLKTEEGAIRYPFIAGMVLPVFEKVTLIPVALEPVYGMPMDDRAWIIYVTKYLPALGKVNNIDDVEGQLTREEFALCRKYHKLIKDLDNLTWRLRGREWLNAEATGHDIYDAFDNVIGHVTDTTNEDHCDDWSSGGGGNRYGPGKLH